MQQSSLIKRPLSLDPKEENNLNETSVGIKYLVALNKPTFFGRIIAFFIIQQRVNLQVDNLVKHLCRFEQKDP